MRVAFYGRSPALKGAENTLLQQRAACEERLNPGEIITAVYFNIGTRAVGNRELPDGFNLDRDGGLLDLIHDAAQPDRAFDIIVTFSPDCFSPHPASFFRALLKLTAAGVPVRTAEYPGPVLTDPADGDR